MAIKIFNANSSPDERKTATKFNSQPLANDPRNHCMPVYEFIPAPGIVNDLFMVCPLLRKYDNPRFQTVGEVIAFWEQMFEASVVISPTRRSLKFIQGLHFMHINHTVHRHVSFLKFDMRRLSVIINRDCCKNNMM